MKKLLPLLLIAFILAPQSALAQTGIAFSFENATLVEESGTHYMEVDVMVQASQSGTRLGDTQVYIDYNTSAFGSNVEANGKITTTKGALLQKQAFGGSTDAYALVNIADNTPSKVSIVYEYLFPGNPDEGAALPTTPTQLMEVQIEVDDPSGLANLGFDADLMAGNQFQSDNSTVYDPVEANDTQTDLPVELTGFEAAASGAEAVQLTWQTASETGNARFVVERQVRREGEAELSGWQRVGQKEGAGTTAEAQSYAFVDEAVPFEAEQVRYRLRQVDLDGTTTYSEAVEVEVAAPQQFALHGAFPNPFRQSTTIRYELPQAAEVTLEVYDVLGRKVRTLADEHQETGRRAVRVEGEGLASGAYFYRLRAGDYAETRRMVVVK